MAAMRVWIAVLTVVLLGACSSASHPASQPTTVTNTNCPATTTTTSTLPPGIPSGPEVIKESGINGGGCYSNSNSAHPLTPGAP